jgi:hypothetical protein
MTIAQVLTKPVSTSTNMFSQPSDDVSNKKPN